MSASDRAYVHPLTAAGTLIRRHPGVLEVLDRHGIVFCAGCYLALMDPLSDVAGYHAVHDPDALMDELESVVAADVRRLPAPVDRAPDAARVEALAAWVAQESALHGAGVTPEAVGEGWVWLRIRDVRDDSDARLLALTAAVARAAVRTHTTAATLVRSLVYERHGRSAASSRDRDGAWLAWGDVEAERNGTFRVGVRLFADPIALVEAQVDVTPLVQEPADGHVSAGVEDVRTTAR